MVRIAVILLLSLAGVLRVGAQHSALPAGFAEAASSTKRFQLASGLTLSVWAAEPQLSNSVAFCFDGRGRVFLAESDRWAISVFDITAHTNWLWQDMSFRNVADRAAFLTNQFSTNLTLLTRDSEAVRMLEDSTGAGRADRSVVVASGFNSVVDGTAAGILATQDRLYFANIPNLWSLQPVPPAGVGNPPKVVAESLGFGFGVHIGVSGHDLHGLIRGPDGRIYLSFGDRGCVLTNREGRVIELRDTGGVLRCEPDGRNLEVFCYGLRNPQELAFDDLGNLWTVDNDTAGADPCRVLHLVEGADYGWRTSYQHMEGFGPWVQEELWKGGQDGILPPAGTVSQGPAGLAFYPGTGFGDRLKGTFLHADFPGGVWAFTVKPQGASYVVDRKEKFLWNCWPTDVDFGPEGGAYILDWVSGWGQTPRGRIYRITPTAPLEPAEVALVAEVRRYLAEGMTQRDEKELLQLLGHADRRVRLEAQWELAQRGASTFEGLKAVAYTHRNLLARLHAIWAIGQIARSIDPFSPSFPGGFADQLFEVMGLLKDPDDQVVAHTARMFGDAGLVNASQRLNELIQSPSPVVAFSAAMARSALATNFFRDHLGAGQETRARVERNVPWLAQLLRIDNPGNQVVNWRNSLLEALSQQRVEDPFVRFARVRLLISQDISDASGVRYNTISDELREFATHPSAKVRGLALEALRLGTNRYLTNFLSDPDPKLIIAAGRAIHDVPIVEGFPALASFITKIDCPTNLYSRVIDACYRLGTQQHAQMLAGFAAREDVPDWARVMALRTLGDWEKPAPLDRVNGLWRPLVTLAAEQRDPNPLTPPAPGSGNPLLDRAAQAQSARNLGRAAEVPVLPPDLGRSIPYAEAMSLRRNPAPAQRAFLRVAGDLLNPFNLNEAGQPAGSREVPALQIAVADVAAALRVKEAGSPLYEKFSDRNTPAALRGAIVPALATLRSPLAADAVKAALADPDPKLRAAALPHVDRLEGADAAAVLAGLVPGKPGEWKLAQAATAQLGRRAPQDPRSAEALLKLAARPGSLPPGLRLDLREALRTAGLKSPELAEGAPSTHPREFLEGGDAIRGRAIFFGHPAVQCLRCHKIGTDGGTVGPDLSAVGGRLSRESLLESILTPNAQIAPGFESVVLTLKDGTNLAGTLKEERGGSLELDALDPDTGEIRRVTRRTSEIATRERGPSAMPEGLADQLSPLELRDLVEFLAGQK